MDGGGLIIRLIDVVMIILLGFLNISDFGIKAQIKLDSGSAEEQQIQTIMYFVTVLPSGSFMIHNNLDDEKLMFADPSGNDDEASRDANLKDLETYILKKFRGNNDNQINTLVVIKSDPETKIQYAIDVLDICEKNAIPRTISY